MNIVVLTGGLSTERDVSISTGTKVYKALKNTGHRVLLLDVFFGFNGDTDGIFDKESGDIGEFGVGITAPDIAEIKKLRMDNDGSLIGPNVIKICKMADITFMALYGENGENGKLQATFDMLGIPYTGTGSLGSAVAMNKGIAKQVMVCCGVDVPSGITLQRDAEEEVDWNGIPLPAVIKPCSGGSSVGVSIAQTIEDLKAAVKTAFEYEDEIIIEQYVKGREFSIGVLGETALPVIEIIPKQGFYDYVNKYQPGLTQEICPALLDEATTKRMQALALKVHKALKLEVYSRIDFLLNEKNEIFCLEANTLPGLTPTSLIPQEAAAAGISYPQLCETIVSLSLRKYAGNPSQGVPSIAQDSAMKSMTVSEIVNACKGRFFGNEDLLAQNITGVTIDSRKVETGFLFIPIKGATFDGNDFIASAYERGALCCLSEQNLEGCRPYIKVESCPQALKDIAEYYRSLFSVNVIAVTGSVGKTSTKDMIYAVLSQKYNVLKTQGNLNNEIGLPQTVFRLRDTHDIAVLEMGMNHFGEIYNLSKVARPHTAVITNIGVSHIENLGSREGILRAKTELLEFLPDGAHLYLNGDDDLLQTIGTKRFRLVFFGMDCKLEVHADNIVSLGLDGTRCDLCFQGETIRVHIPSPGVHMVYNALVAAALGRQFSMSADEIARGIESFSATGSRMNILKVNDLTIIDDAYNASPASMKAALDVLACALGRKVCILGDMLELGDQATAFHREVGCYAAEKGIDLILCVGQLAQGYADGAAECKTQSKALYYSDREEFAKEVQSIIDKGDTVLVKASRGMHFEKIVERLK